MSETDHQLNRLLRAAATGGFRAEEKPPLGFASRVFAECRALRSENADLVFAALCRKAVLFSYGIAALFLLLNVQSLEIFRELNAWHAADVRLIDSALQLPNP